MKKWPFPGDMPTARARKVALAYRHTAIAAEERADAAEKLLRKLPDSVIRFYSAELAEQINAYVQDMSRSRAQAEEVLALDRRFHDWGETWHMPGRAWEMDDYVRGEDAAQLIQLSPEGIHKARQAGKLKGIVAGGKGTGNRPHYLYRVGDVYEYGAAVKARKAQTTDKLRDQEPVHPDDGQSREPRQEPGVAAQPVPPGLPDVQGMAGRRSPRGKQTPQKAEREVAPKKVKR